MGCFCLVTPNWSMQLPDQPYDGADPDGFDPRDDIVAFLERYADQFEVPVEEGVDVSALEPGDSGFHLETSSGPIEAPTVVLTTGAYQQPYRPPHASTLPADVLQIDVEGYHSPGALPDGPVLVVGSGQSGWQIAEELAVPAATSSSRAARPRGSRGGPGTTTSPGGWTNRDSSTGPSNRSRSRGRGSGRTSSRAGAATATTCTGGGCTSSASCSSDTSPGRRGRGLVSS